MGIRIRILFILIMLFIGASFVPREASAQGGCVSMQVFYDELSPYGNWVVNPDYGYVWIPNAGPGFSPYASEGYWLLTNQGWAWVSYYSWGWAPFHYGRWYYDPYYGHVWVPDDVWGPGWVTWRRSNDYYGWAPIGPGMSNSMAYRNNYYVLEHQWVFVRNRDFGSRTINRYYVDNSNNVTIINNSTVINNTYVDKSRNVTYNAGPDRAEVEKRVGRPIKPVDVKESNTPGSQRVTKDRLQIYKPQVNNNLSAEGKNPSPANVKSWEDVKPAAQKTGGTQQDKTLPPARQQPAKQRPAKQQRVDQPVNQQPPMQQQADQPGRQQPAKQQQRAEPARQKTLETQKASQPKKTGSENQPRQPRQPRTTKNTDTEKPPQ